MRNISRFGALTLLAAALSFNGCALVERIEGNPPPRQKRTFHSRKQGAQEAVVKIRRPLFVIERSINKNIVRYETQLTADGRLDPAEPIVAYWVMLAEDGRSEDLTWVERIRAYGFTLEPGSSGNTYKLLLAPAPDRPWLIRKDGGNFCAEGLINGRPAIMEKIFVKLSPGFLGPKVEDVELYGKNIRTGEACSEKIKAK